MAGVAVSQTLAGVGVADAVGVPRSAEGAGSGCLGGGSARCCRVLVWLVAPVALVVGFVGGVVAARFAAARRRAHRRRAREVLDERAGERGYPWP